MVLAISPDLILFWPLTTPINEVYQTLLLSFFLARILSYFHHLSMLEVAKVLLVWHQTTVLTRNFLSCCCLRYSFHFALAHCCSYWKCFYLSVRLTSISLFVPDGKFLNLSRCSRISVSLLAVLSKSTGTFWSQFKRAKRKKHWKQKAYHVIEGDSTRNDEARWDSLRKVGFVLFCMIKYSIMYSCQVRNLLNYFAFHMELKQETCALYNLSTKLADALHKQKSCTVFFTVRGSPDSNLKTGYSDAFIWSKNV